MKELQVFNYEEKQMRTVQREDGLWWVLKDVCDVLGLGSPHKVADRLDEDEKGRNLIPTLGGEQSVYIVNESGLYNVILRSDKPEAKKFKRWVTHDVLPTIRKHGAYMTPETLEAAILNPDTMIRLCTKLKAEQEARGRLELENAQQRQIIGELKPLADYTSVILKNPGLVTITQIAKDYGMSGRAMNRLLAEKGVQYKQSGQWLLYQKYHDKGYTHSKTIDIVRTDGTKDVRMETKWTQKGRLFLYELLKADGILPVIERDMTA